MQFLGSLGGEYNIGLVETTDSQSLESAVAWDTTKHLDFAVPFNDMKLSIYLGELWVTLWIMIDVYLCRDRYC